MTGRIRLGWLRGKPRPDRERPGGRPSGFILGRRDVRCFRSSRQSSSAERARGGRDSMTGTLFAVLLPGVLQSRFPLLQYSPYLPTAAVGLALVAAVQLDQTTRHRERD